MQKTYITLLKWNQDKKYQDWKKKYYAAKKKNDAK